MHKTLLAIIPVALVLVFGGLLSLARRSPAQESPAPISGDHPPRASHPLEDGTRSTCLGFTNSELLPRLPTAVSSRDVENLLQPRSSKSFAARNSGFPDDPDGLKILAGFRGTYYNITNLDDTVKVLPDSIHTWSGETWIATGLIRNQSCIPVHITRVTAELYGSEGDHLGQVHATTPVSSLRPGEPAPFIASSSIPSDKVASIDWKIDSHSEDQILRPFRLAIFEAGKVLRGTRYSLYGSIQNLGTQTTQHTRVIAAWVDGNGKLIFVNSPRVRLVSDPKREVPEIDLPPGTIEDFNFATDDPAIVQLLSGSHVILWGVSQ